MRRIAAILAFLVAGLAAAGAAEVIDRIVTVVNRTPILQTDWDDEVRFESFIEGRNPLAVTDEEKKQALERLIDQALIGEQLAASNYVRVRDAEIDSAVAELKSQIAPAGGEWAASLARYGLTETDLRSRVRKQVDQLRYIEMRFRPDARVSNAEIEKYYREQFVPAVERAGGKAKPMADVQPQIRQILTEEKISELMTSWLATLHTQAGIADHERVNQRSAAEKVTGARTGQ